MRPFVSQAYNPNYWKPFTEQIEAPICLGCGWRYRRPECQETRMYCRACESRRENQ